MALSGMTGFGRAEGALGDWTWAVEARSVNGRNLEIRFKAPPGFDVLEKATRDAAQARFARGQVSVNVQARRSEASGAVRINRDQIERYLAAVEPLIEVGRVHRPSADGLLALRGVLEVQEAEDDADARTALETAIAGSIALALDGLRTARLSEGASLTPVLGGLIDRIEVLVAAAEAEATMVPAMLKARFEARMAELLGQAMPEERVVQEAAVMAGKADVREELDRLTGHVAAARALIAGEGASGRRLDFLTQEFMREANTLCSKSATSALTAIGLDLKAVIEQFREQVQNVE